MIKPLISILEHLRKRCGLVDLAMVEGTKVPVDEPKLPIRHELVDRVLRVLNIRLGGTAMALDRSFLMYAHID